MTRDEFTERMKIIADNAETDPEMYHYAADELLCEVLRDFGYDEGVDIFDQMTKWYA